MALPKGLGHAYWSAWRQRGDTVSQSLESDETWIGGWDAVGLYEGNNKVPEYQVMSIHLTTHRLILVPEPIASTSSKPPNSLQVQLRHVRQTEFYTGFMRSSAKITLSLGRPAGSPDNDQTSTARSSSDGAARGGGSWTCSVCAFVNPLLETETEPGPSSKCGLCGVGYATSKSISRPVSRTANKSTSTPSPTPASTSTSTNEPPAPAEGQGDKRIPCPACTFLNHPSLRECEICSTPLPRRRPVPTSSPAIPQANGNGVSPAVGGMDIVRLSFREGGAKEAYRRLKNVLSDKAWERASSNGRPSTPARGTDSPRPGAGIDGILQTISLEAKAKDEHMKDAFKDLEVLMVRAGEMVKMAQSLNARLTAAGGAGVNEEEATLIRSSLVQLGLPAPALTQDMVRDEQKYHEGLAKELGGLLTGSASKARTNVGSEEGGLMVGKDGRGVIGLDEVWGLWMRARGVALLPPSTLVEIIPYLAKSTSPPIHLLTLPSSLQVLHTPAYAPPAILARVLTRLTPSEDEVASTEASISLIEIASYENLPVGLAGELMASIERIDCPPGIREPVGLVRDDQAVGDGGVRWYRDLISGWEL